MGAGATVAHGVSALMDALALSNAMAAGGATFRPTGGMTVGERDRYYQAGAAADGLHDAHDQHHQGQQLAPPHHFPAHHHEQHQQQYPQHHGHNVYGGLDHAAADLTALDDVIAHQHGIVQRDRASLLPFHALIERLIRETSGCGIARA